MQSVSYHFHFVFRRVLRVEESLVDIGIVFLESLVVNSDLKVLGKVIGVDVVAVKFS